MSGQVQSQLQLNLVGLSLALFSVYPATQPPSHPATQNSTEIAVNKLDMDIMKSNKAYKWKMTSMEDDLIEDKLNGDDLNERRFQ